ncbi:MAG: DUF502 domain-containing protein [Elusimicrobia bacterium]|nr:DUF502 domain-containing protein [Elusimicrobiota bacterium]
MGLLGASDGANSIHKIHLRRRARHGALPLQHKNKKVQQGGFLNPKESGLRLIGFVTQENLFSMPALTGTADMVIVYLPMRLPDRRVHGPGPTVGAGTRQYVHRRRQPSGFHGGNVDTKTRSPRGADRRRFPGTAPPGGNTCPPIKSSRSRSWSGGVF